MQPCLITNALLRLSQEGFARRTAEDRKMNWYKEATRKSIPFYHETDFSRLPSIIQNGLRPASARPIFDNFGNPDGREPAAVWFGRDDSSISHGPETTIKTPVLLSGFIPVSFMEQHGISDADFAYRKEVRGPYADVPTRYDEEGSEIEDTGKWNESYWQKPYGAAGVQKTVPWNWVQKVKVKDVWYPRQQFQQQFARNLSSYVGHRTRQDISQWENLNKQRDAYTARGEERRALWAEYQRIKPRLSAKAQETADMIFNATNHHETEYQHYLANRSR